MIKNITTICLMIMVSISASHADTTQIDGVEINPQILDVQHRLTVLEHKFSMKSDQPKSFDNIPSDFIEVARQHWTHSPKGIIICMKTMEKGECFTKLKGRPGEEIHEPHPWFTPQEFLDHAYPELTTKLVDLDYYPPTGKVFIYYSVNN